MKFYIEPYIETNIGLEASAPIETWECDFCGSLNEAKTKRCSGCSNTKENEND